MKELDKAFNLLKNILTIAVKINSLVEKLRRIADHMSVIKSAGKVL